MQLEDLYKKSIEGRPLKREEALWLAQDTPLDGLIEAAHGIRLGCAGKKFHFCSIVNAKSGACSEDCAWCAQSVHHATGVETYALIDVETALKAASAVERQGIRHSSFVTSGKSLGPSDVDRLCGMLRILRKHVRLSFCASLGLISPDSLRKLREAGLSRYHCNLETSARYFGELCHTHTYSQKIAVLAAAKDAGLEICSGGIIGMGEDMADRIDMALHLRTLGVNSIPINFLQPIKGTPLQDRPLLDEEEILRTVAVFRFILPSACLRFAGGRLQLSEGTMRKALHAGINAAITGNMLTTSGSAIEEDKRRIGDAGYEKA